MAAQAEMSAQDAALVQAAEEHGYALVARVDSRLAGPRGNREIFVSLRPREGADRG